MATKSQYYSKHIIEFGPTKAKIQITFPHFVFATTVLDNYRYSLGSIIQYLGITDAKDVNLYSPDPLVQKYIGIKFAKPSNCALGEAASHIS